MQGKAKVESRAIGVFTGVDKAAGKIGDTFKRMLAKRKTLAAAALGSAPTAPAAATPSSSAAAAPTDSVPSPLDLDQRQQRQELSSAEKELNFDGKPDTTEGKKHGHQ